MESPSIELTVRRAIADHFGLPLHAVTRATRFTDEDLNADSLDTVELIMLIEDAAGIAIPDAVAAKVMTVGEVLDYLEGENGAASASRLKPPPDKGSGHAG